VASQAAIQHYEEKFKHECLKNIAISKELTTLKATVEELLNNTLEK
jgi:hypothetical protein